MTNNPAPKPLPAVLPPMPRRPVMLSQAKRLQEGEFVEFPIREDKKARVYLPIHSFTRQQHDSEVITMWPPPDAGAYSREVGATELITFWRGGI